MVPPSAIGSGVWRRRRTHGHALAVDSCPAACSASWRHRLFASPANRGRRCTLLLAIRRALGISGRRRQCRELPLTRCRIGECGRQPLIDMRTVGTHAERSAHADGVADRDVGELLASCNGRAHSRRGEARAAPAGPARRAGVAADRARSRCHRVHPCAAVGEWITHPVGPRPDSEHAGCESAVDGSDLRSCTRRAHQVDHQPRSSGWWTDPARPPGSA